MRNNKTTITQNKICLKKVDESESPEVISLPRSPNLNWKKAMHKIKEVVIGNSSTAVNISLIFRNFMNRA
jgi:hypothetical protein